MLSRSFSEGQRQRLMTLAWRSRTVFSVQAVAVCALRPNTWDSSSNYIPQEIHLIKSYIATQFNMCLTEHIDMISCISENHLPAAQRLVSGLKHFPLTQCCTSQLVVTSSLLIQKYGTTFYTKKQKSNMSSSSPNCGLCRMADVPLLPNPLIAAL